MRDHALNCFDRAILRLIVEAPGSSGYQLHQALSARVAGGSKIRKALGWLIGPSFGQLYVSLAKLENFDLVKSEWGEATKERGWHRPRLYSLALGAPNLTQDAQKGGTLDTAQGTTSPVFATPEQIAILDEIESISLRLHRIVRKANGDSETIQIAVAAQKLVLDYGRTFPLRAPVTQDKRGTE